MANLRREKSWSRCDEEKTPHKPACDCCSSSGCGDHHAHRPQEKIQFEACSYRRKVSWRNWSHYVLISTAEENLNEQLFLNNFNLNNLIFKRPIMFRSNQARSRLVEKCLFGEMSSGCSKFKGIKRWSGFVHGFPVESVNSLFALKFENEEKRKPVKPDDSTCCGTGCSPCVFDVYEENVMEYNKWLIKKGREGEIMSL